MSTQHVIVDGETIAAGQEFRPLPNLDVSGHSRLQLLISAGVSSVSEVGVREFSHETSANYGGTGFVLSVPVIAPQLYDVILSNRRAKSKVQLWVTLLAQ